MVSENRKNNYKSQTYCSDYCWDLKNVENYLQCFIQVNGHIVADEFNIIWERLVTYFKLFIFFL